MKPRDDPLSSTSTDINNEDYKCCNCEIQLTPENEVTHIPSYLSATPGELIKIKDAVLIVFEGDIRAKQFTFQENEKVGMCADCTPSFIDMYNAYTKFMGLTRGTSWLKKTIKESVVWTDLSDDEVDEERESTNNVPVNVNGKVVVQFEKVKREQLGRDEIQRTTKKSKTMVNDDEVDTETVILPDLSSSPPRASASSSRRKTNQSTTESFENYTERFPCIKILPLTESQLQSANNFAAFLKIKEESDVKVEVDVTVKDLIKNESQDPEAEAEYGSASDTLPKIVDLQSITTSTSATSKVFSVNRCPVCARIFPDYQGVTAHYGAAHQMGARNFTCQLCNTEFTLEWFYKDHINKYHDGIELTFSCQICSKSFTTSIELLEHKDTFHSNSDNDHEVAVNTMAEAEEEDTLILS